MRKILIFAFVLMPLFSIAQEINRIQQVDSITYQYYLTGDWDRLIYTAKQAIKDSIDFKYLRQRLGYAYFAKGNYYASQQQYEKALAQDPTDVDTRTYLYYCGIYTANEGYTRYRAGQLPQNIQQQYQLKSFKLVNAVDFEYNYKANTSAVRGNPQYWRVGIETNLNYKTSLYQSFSSYWQTNKSTIVENNTFTKVSTKNADSSSIRQNEYFAQLNWTINPHLNLSVGYHYINSKINARNIFSYKLTGNQYNTVKDTTTTTSLIGNMLNTKLTYTYHRLNIGVSASVLDYDSIVTQQYGIQAGICLPGKMSVYLRSSVYGMLDSDNDNRLIFNQSIGALFFKKWWLEGNITLGNLKNFSDNNGLYLYNSLDATTFRAGASLFWYMTPKITWFGNYTFDTKQRENTNSNYYQHSFSSGIIWKL